jgi:hypothetical protein
MQTTYNNVHCACNTYISALVFMLLAFIRRRSRKLHSKRQAASEGGRLGLWRQRQRRKKIFQRRRRHQSGDAHKGTEERPPRSCNVTAGLGAAALCSFRTMESNSACTIEYKWNLIKRTKCVLCPPDVDIDIL